ncbi:hypothetical protein [Sphingobacterium sp. MYb382]|uniref:hypothetical protein n=1 Tax=Sphingobacterium sp. MYb382 TaxID=2745278 RepID=UPI00403F687A
MSTLFKVYTFTVPSSAVTVYLVPSAKGTLVPDAGLMLAFSETFSCGLMLSGTAWSGGQ